MNNTLKEKILKGDMPIGTMVQSASPFIVEGLGRTGLDYVVIDNEHSPMEAESSVNLIRAAELTGICPIVRVREISRPAILKLLDVGAKGLIIPNVHSVEDVKRIVNYSKFAPVGKRGYCPSRKDGWGFDDMRPLPDQMRKQNEQVLIIPQCETVGALAAIEDIVKIVGVDGIFVGPYDLSIDMGIPGQFTTLEFQHAIERIIAACHNNNKFCMCFASNADAAVDGFKKGYDSITFGMDMGMLIDAYRQAVKDIRKICRTENLQAMRCS